MINFKSNRQQNAGHLTLDAGSKPTLCSPISSPDKWGNHQWQDILFGISGECQYKTKLK